MKQSKERMDTALETIRNSITRLQAYEGYPYREIHIAITNERLKIIEEVHPATLLMEPTHAEITAYALLDYTRWVQEFMQRGIKEHERKTPRERLRDIRKKRGM